MEAMPVVIGADGFVGTALARGLAATPVVYREPRKGEVHISKAAPIVSRAEVIVNAAGFRVRRGLTLQEYRMCHVGATASLVSHIRPGTLLIHMSSAHVLGKSPDRAPGNDSAAQPESYPCHEYAIAKYETDLFLEKAASHGQFRVIFLRPTILYDRQGDGSLIDTLLQLRKGGIKLRLYPRSARHHLCHLSLLVDVAQRVRQKQLPQFSKLVVADPYTITNVALESLFEQYMPARGVTVPIPASLAGKVLRRCFHSKKPSRDLSTWGQILGVLHLDTAYDPFGTFRLLSIDIEKYSMFRTLVPFITSAAQSVSPASRQATTHAYGNRDFVSAARR